MHMYSLQDALKSLRSCLIELKFCMLMHYMHHCFAHCNKRRTAKNVFAHAHHVTYKISSNKSVGYVKVSCAILTAVKNIV